MRSFTKSTQLPASIDQAFAYHARPGALRRLIPPWEAVRIAQSSDSIEVGAKVSLEMTMLGLFSARWNARHTQYDPPVNFRDEQESGPMAHWVHDHRFRSIAPTITELTDHIEYRLPLGAVGDLLGAGHVSRQLRRMFDYRHIVTQNDLSVQSRWNSSPLRIAISGQSGMIGNSLSALLTTAGHTVMPLVRKRSDDSSSDRSSSLLWSINEGLANPADAESLDAMVHLAGKGIGEHRWSSATKSELVRSRVPATRKLCEQLAKLRKPPRVFVCASATGIYGDRGDEELDEDSSPGTGFLAELATQWEHACSPLAEVGTRVIHARFGIVLHPRFGALAKLLPAIRYGVGGKFGTGRQYWSWISLDDACYALYQAIFDDRFAGAINFVAPQQTSNAEFVQIIAKQLYRPAFFAVPGFVLRLGLGEMAQALLLSSQRVRPSRLSALGFQFQFPQLDLAVRHLLGLAEPRRRA